MTKYISDRLIKIRLLRTAKDYLHPNWPNAGICNALAMAAARDGGRTYWAELDLKHYILAALGNCDYYQQWLFAKGLMPTDKEIYQGRLAWIDWIIACYTEDIERAEQGLPPL